MKIIEGMREIKMLEEKINDLIGKIKSNSANLDVEPTEYKDDAPNKIKDWVQSCTDCTKRIIEIKEAIARTNLMTNVTITLGEKDVTRSIFGWINRRAKFAQIDMQVYAALTPRGISPRPYIETVNGVQENKWQKLVLNYDPTQRDKKIAEYQSEPHQINSVLEVVNATTDLIFN